MQQGEPSVNESSASTGTTQDALQALEPLRAARLWLHVLGWSSIAGGTIYCLSIVGALVGWLPIWIGVLIWRGARSLEESFASRDASGLTGGFEAMGKAVKLQGILTLVGLALTGLYLCVVVAVLIATAVNS